MLLAKRNAPQSFGNDALRIAQTLMRYGYRLTHPTAGMPKALHILRDRC